MSKLNETTNITFSDEARQKLSKGVEKLAKAVSCTMGPKGRNVLIQKEYKSTLTKDGVSVARAINLEDTLENMGAQLIKEVAQNTEKDAGDGTTTATVLANAIFQAGLRNVTSGANPLELKKGMELASNLILENLKNITKEVTTVLETEQVATISANGDNTIGKMISEAIDKVGQDGIITVQEAKGIKDELDVVMGMQLQRGYLSPYFITNKTKLTVEYNDVRILLLNDRITHLKDILPALQFAQEKKQPLLIICEDIDGEALNTLVLNKMRKILDVVVVKTPGFADTRKDYLEDIAVLTNAEVIDPRADIHLHSTDNQLGTCDKIDVEKLTCTIIGGNANKENLEKRITELKELISKETEPHFKKVYQERLAKLTGGIAVIKVSAMSDTETSERKDRVDDALGATKSAQEEGIIPGGGSALIQSSYIKIPKNLSNDELIGFNIVLDAVKEPCKQIAKNAGKNGDTIIEKVSELKLGYDASNNEYKDMFEAGIIDSYKVQRIALTNAVSVSSMLLTTECIISKVD